MSQRSALLIILLSFSVLAQSLPLEKLQLPSGFTINVYAENVNKAREMALSDDGTVFVGSTSDKVYAILPEQTKRGLHKVITIANNLYQPSGVAYYQGDLYVAEVDRVIRFNQITAHLNHPPKPQLVTDDLPRVATSRGQKQRHGWKFIRLSPKGILFIASGVPCDSCLSADPRFGTLMHLNPKDHDLEIYATGVRNSVGFDWDPITRKLWFTDNGRDWLGDNSPPDKLNYAPHRGLFYGFPYYHGKDGKGNPIADPKYGKLRSPDGITWPALQLPAHVAALGMTFYTGQLFPTAYHNQIILAEHGSWNRSKKVGYRLTLVKLNKHRNKAISYQPFVTGWLQGQKVWGRPVATLVMPDGSLLASDDHAGVIYRITYSAPKP